MVSRRAGGDGDGDANDQRSCLKSVCVSLSASSGSLAKQEKGRKGRVAGGVRR